MNTENDKIILTDLAPNILFLLPPRNVFMKQNENENYIERALNIEFLLPRSVFTERMAVLNTETFEPLVLVTKKRELSSAQTDCQ